MSTPMAHSRDVRGTKERDLEVVGYLPSSDALRASCDGITAAIRAASAAAYAADAAWQAELDRIYGSRAADARYDARGRATPRLAELDAQARATSAEMGAAWQRRHAATRAAVREGSE